MTTTNNNEDVEKKIVEAAKELFIENGFAETSMSDIAAKVGINRPVLHYYFRTKDKMFQAVFGNIILSFIPRIHDIIIQQDKSVSESIGEIVDAYYKVFTENPCLPLFMVREMHRDMDHLSTTIKELRLEQYLHKIMDVLQEEMNGGRLKTVPLPFVFYTFYSVDAMINKDERRDVSIRKPRPSIRKQLADSKQATSPKKAAARTKKNELEV